MKLAWAGVVEIEMEPATVICLERGWGAHFIGAMDCEFRRNTLLQKGNTRLIVSTVGAWYPVSRGEHMEELGCDVRDGVTIGYYYETMVFFAALRGWYWDVDTRAGTLDVYADCHTRAHTVAELPDDVDLAANKMHERVKEEITTRLLNGEFDAEAREIQWRRDPESFAEDVEEDLA